MTGQVWLLHQHAGQEGFGVQHEVGCQNVASQGDRQRNAGNTGPSDKTADNCDQTGDGHFHIEIPRERA